MVTAYLIWMETFHRYEPGDVYFVAFVLDLALISPWIYFIVMAANYPFT